MRELATGMKLKKKSLMVISIAIVLATIAIMVAFDLFANSKDRRQVVLPNEI